MLFFFCIQSLHIEKGSLASRSHYPHQYYHHHYHHHRYKLITNFNVRMLFKYTKLWAKNMFVKFSWRCFMSLSSVKGKRQSWILLTQIEPIWALKRGLMDIYTCLFCQMQLPCLFCGHVMTVNMQLFISTPLKSPTCTPWYLKTKTR